MTELPPEPFFCGPGLDRADALRADDEALRSLTADAAARELKWRDGLPELTADGRLVWGAPLAPQLFLGFDGKAPRFCAIALWAISAAARSPTNWLIFLIGLVPSCLPDPVANRPPRLPYRRP